MTPVDQVKLSHRTAGLRKARNLALWSYAYSAVALVLAAVDADAAYIAMMLTCAVVNIVGSVVIRTILETNDA